jgi:uncharacterized protein (DUF885 family)
MKKTRSLLLMVLLLTATAHQAQALPPPQSDDAALERLFESFVAEYPAQKIPPFQMAYVDNFNAIPGPDGIQRQHDFFASYQAKLAKLDHHHLSLDHRYQADSLAFELTFNLARLALERTFKKAHPGPVQPQEGFAGLPSAHEWYQLYVTRWASKPMTPEALGAFGQAEVDRINGEIRKLQDQAGFAGNDAGFRDYLASPAFTITDEQEVQRRLRDTWTRVKAGLGRDFLPTAVPDIQWKPIPNASKDTPPGFYDKGVFYYNFFNQRFPVRALSWIFLHEAVPGHHYQTVVSANRPAIGQLFWYPGYSEGWGAYVEDLGDDLGLYQDAAQSLGKWEWDLVRSARLVLDVGINFRGWTRAQALAYWHANVFNQAGIAEREVDRITRWPAQAVSYKVGEKTILDLKQQFRARWGDAFDVRRFHALILRRGSLPLVVLDTIVRDDLVSPAAGAT